MKKKIGLFLGLIIVSVTLIACNESSAEASIPSGFEVVTQDKINKGAEHVITVKHIKTKCLYVLTHTKGNGNGGGITQMFIEKDGASVPFCE